MRGEIIPGKLFAEKNRSYVLDTDGTRRDIDLQQIARVVQPGMTLKTTAQPIALTYIDGTVLHGQVTQLNSDSVQLQTTFVDAPITCSLAGAALLKFASTLKTQAPVEDYDKLFYASRSLRGRISFDSKDADGIQWQPVGTSESVRLANVRGARVERALQRVSEQKPFDMDQFPHLLHLTNGEVIPCQVSSYNETTIGFSIAVYRCATDRFGVCEGGLSSLTKKHRQRQKIENLLPSHMRKVNIALYLKMVEF